MMVECVLNIIGTAEDELHKMENESNNTRSGDISERVPLNIDSESERGDCKIDRVRNNSKDEGGEDSDSGEVENDVEHDNGDSGEGEEWVLVAPDGGWGWMVVLGSVTIAMLIPMLAPCFGILYSELLIGLGASSVSVAWVFNLFMLMWKMTIVFVGPIGREIGVRMVAMFGGGMAALAVMSTAFANSVSYLICCFSILAGTGSGLCMGSCFPTLAQYFQRRCGLANAFFMAGISAGQLVNALLIRFLQQQYSYSGATLIVGAIVLHTCAAAALLHPVKWHMKRVPRNEADSPETLPSPPVPTKHHGKKHGGGLLNTLVRVFYGTIRELQILKERRALVMGLIGAFSLNSHFNFIAMVPFAMQDAGHSLSWAAWVVSVTALTNILTRILVSIMADHQRFPLRAVYMVGAAIVTVTSLAWTFVMGDVVIGMVVMGVWGSGVGLVMGLHNLAMVQTIGLGNLRAMFGANNVMVGLGFITVGPLAGMVRDVTESYAASMWMLSGIMSLCIVLWCLMPAAVASDARRAAEEAAAAESPQLCPLF